MQSFDLIVTYTHGMNKDLLTEKEEIKCNNIIRPCKKKINFDDPVKRT